ncbi:MAG: hypothetical protein EZS28_015127 [Streblomastix strix]|uniref:Uncharacterized protein n=1 Tax=Streblomastix strix TaxID=222440 RepID=A0A5J4W441_9EUKA|nr:MAG: hypothetical protein EZS28_015127 [Streblomastix strix]
MLFAIKKDDAFLLLKADKNDIIDSYSKSEDDALLLLKAYVADIVDSYFKKDDDALFLLKANIVDIVDSYSKTEDDTLLDAKTDKSDTYTKTKTDTLLDAKADKSELIDSYSKTEDDALLLLKADKSDTQTETQTDSMLDEKADKTELIDSYTKSEEDALSILKANAVDLIIYVDLISAQTIPAQKQFVTDYRWDGIDLRELETELSDMSNVITTLGAATGGGNAITDILIDRNVLNPAKNKKIVDTDYDQSISGQQIFSTTIHSVGIMVQTYDNSSVVCKGLQAGSISLDAIYANNAYDRMTDLANFRNDAGDFIDEPRVRKSIENNRFIRLHPNGSRNKSRTT